MVTAIIHAIHILQLHKKILIQTDTANDRYLVIWCTQKGA